MLQQFFENFAVLIIPLSIVIAVIIKMIVPVCRFIEKAENAIELYSIFEKFIKDGFSIKEKVEVQCGKYSIKAADDKEAIMEFEKIINDALKYYDKLGSITIATGYLETWKDKLIRICNEVRCLKWQKQGI